MDKLFRLPRLSLVSCDALMFSLCECSLNNAPTLKSSSPLEQLDNEYKDSKVFRNVGNDLRKNAALNFRRHEFSATLVET